jgi:hypothetical protein
MAGLEPGDRLECVDSAAARLINGFELVNIWATTI